MAGSSRFLWKLLLFISIQIAIADDACWDPGCSDPFPPGHEEMGIPYWAIGDESFDAIMETVTTFLTIPEAPTRSPGVMTINPAMENTVSNMPFRPGLRILQVSPARLACKS